jgi:hypothetical protein
MVWTKGWRSQSNPTIPEKTGKRRKKINSFGTLRLNNFFVSSALPVNAIANNVKV